MGNGLFFPPCTPLWPTHIILVCIVDVETPSFIPPMIHIAFDFNAFAYIS